jgi:hypothetical protein
VGEIEMPSRFEPCVVDEVRFGYFRNCGISIWAQTTSGVTRALAKQDELITFLNAGYPDAVMLITVICPGNRIPTSGQRKEIEAFFEQWVKNWRAVVMVAEGNDLWSVTARSVMTALRLVQRRPYATKIFSETTDASQWASKYLVDVDSQNGDEAARQLLQSVEDLRTRAF